MIEPISLKMTGQYIIITEAISSGTDEIGSKYPVEACIIDSGRLKGTVIAYVRYLAVKPGMDTLWTDEYPWQVIKQRTPKETDRFHYSTTKTLEQALQLVMACAYEYSAFN